MARIAIPDGEGEETTRLWAMNPDLAKGLIGFSTAVYAGSKLHARVREFARMRVAQINDCPV